MDTDPLTREAIAGALDAALRPLPHVLALLEGGAVAWGRIDAWSDLDLNVYVEEGRFDETFRAVEEALAALSPIEHTFVAHGPSGEPGMQQRFYRLERAGPFLLVDLAVIAPSAPEKYLQREIHGEGLVYFDKAGVTKAPPPLDRAAFDAKMRARLDRLRTRFALFAPFVEKELHRRNALEAIDMYRAIVLNSLLEVLRMRHGPLHYNFGIRYVHRELPPEAVRRLVPLAYVRDADDLAAKYREASAWFRETAEELAARAP